MFQAESHAAALFFGEQFVFGDVGSGPVRVTGDVIPLGWVQECHAMLPLTLLSSAFVLAIPDTRGNNNTEIPYSPFSIHHISLRSEIILAVGQYVPPGIDPGLQGSLLYRRR